MLEGLQLFVPILDAKENVVSITVRTISASQIKRNNFYEWFLAFIKKIDDNAELDLFRQWCFGLLRQ